MPSRSRSAMHARPGGAGVSAGRSESRDLYGMLKQDHDKVKQLLDMVTEKESQPREELFAQIEKELHDHMEGEENYFYPALEDEEDSREKILEAYEEHHVAKTVLDELGGTSPEDETWLPKMKVLKELVNHHIQEEEKNVFKMARKQLSDDEADDICEQIMESKREEEGENPA